MFYSSSIKGDIVLYSTNFNHNLVVKEIALDVALFDKNIQKKFPQWAQDQIQEDFLAFRGGQFSKSDLDNFFLQNAESLRLLRITVKNRRLSYSIEESFKDLRFWNVIYAVKKLYEISDLPDIDVLISLHDSLDTELSLPVCVFAKNKHLKTQPLIPDFEALGGYEGLRKEVEKGLSKYPWNKKINKVFWRGSSTGGWLTTVNWHENARCKISMISNQFPSLVDAKISNICQCDDEVRAILISSNLLGSAVSVKDHFQYKYLIDIDGNSCTYSRFFWLLLSNCLTLKQVTENIQWYYKGISPWQHYIPIKADMSDLLEKLAQVGSENDRCLAIIAQANDFAKKNLNQEMTYAYLYYVLKNYQHLICK